MLKFAIGLTALLLGSLWLPFACADRPLLVLGDSLSAAYGIAVEDGWVALLDQYLEQRQAGYTVINASISGDTSQGGLERLPVLLATHKPAIVIVELGANDGLRGFPLPVVTDNLQQIIRLARGSGARVLLIGMRIPPNYGAKYTSMFYHNYQQLAEQEQIPLVPFLLDGVAARDAMMQADGLHPTALAQTTMLNNVLPELLPLLESSTTTTEPKL